MSANVWRAAAISGGLRARSRARRPGDKGGYLRVRRYGDLMSQPPRHDLDEDTIGDPSTPVRALSSGGQAVGSASVVVPLAFEARTVEAVEPVAVSTVTSLNIRSLLGTSRLRLCMRYHTLGWHR